MPAQLTKSKNDQSGFASIVIAIVLILVLSLITVGFAQLMQREQRSALDRQLSSQAYYAAESGINVAMTAINAGFNTTKNTCGPYDATSIKNVDPASQPWATQYLLGKTSNQVGTSTTASYPCLLINPTPSSVTYSNIATNAPTVFEMKGVDASDIQQTINTIEVSWQPVNPDPATTTFNQRCDSGLFPPVSDPAVGDTGMLQVELIPLNNLSRTGLIDSAYTVFLCPTTNTSNTSKAYTLNAGINTSSGVIVNGACDTSHKSGTTPLYCNAQITGLSQPTFFVELQSIYNPTRVTVTAYNNGSNPITAPPSLSPNQLDISGAQILIDSTGKAQDVLRRIQVRAPVRNSYNMPSASSGALGICKQLQVAPSPAISNNACNP